MLKALVSKLLFQLTSLAIRPGDQVTIVALSLMGFLSLSLVPFGQTPRMAKPSAPPKFVIDPNTASEAELLLLPRVGPSLAGAIVNERKKRPFETPADVGRTHGIGDKTLQKLLPHLQTSSSKFHPESQ